MVKYYKIHHKANALQHAGAFDVYFLQWQVWGVPNGSYYTLKWKLLRLPHPPPTPLGVMPPQGGRIQGHIYMDKLLFYVDYLQIKM